MGVVPDSVPDRCEEQARPLTRRRCAGDHLLREVAHRSAVVIEEEGRLKVRSRRRRHRHRQVVVGLPDLDDHASASSSVGGA